MTHLQPALVTRRIVAIGGGGFLLDDARLLQESYLISLCRKSAPRVLFLGTASGDAERAQLKFYKAFSSLGCLPSSLSFFPFDMRRDYAQEVLEADLIYVGGGNTVAMLAVWREFGLDVALRQAYAAGTVLAGISAGANCWFEQYITDSVPGGGIRGGLGLLAATFCPHLDSEAWRQPLLASVTGVAVGAGENVCVLFENEQFSEAVHSADSMQSTVMCESSEAGGIVPRFLM
ncbi:Type 1 glutamine amidotransferase-like domain-containing protein [Iodobacter sp. LRB]|uniref:Type 1 glutamine amidotransferase-like domain-containing protein n=1 Tax=unclassified Iodobacter TaxID=235634 RepID=UPI000C0D1FC3|nr:Type 1 glutamine amidotransferase-like domain-containing protein [Iodobacter sp. BJB302]PHV00107.1 peptidase E [Iodobacter sp. BJB302]